MCEFVEVLCDLDPKKCCCGIPSIALGIWMTVSFIHSMPRFYIHDFYVPALNISNNASNLTRNVNHNHSIFFNLELKNQMDDHGIRYGDINLTFFYGTKFIGNYTVPAFRQGKGKKARRSNIIETHAVPWGDAIRAVSNHSTVFFRVDLAGRMKFKYMFWYSKRKGVNVGANVEVNEYGEKVEKKDIRLKSAAPNRGCYTWLVVLLVFVSLLASF